MPNTSSKSPVVIHWFRRDLRLEDNRAFSRALRAAAKAGPDVGVNARVLPLFIFDQSILKKLEDRDDARVTFIHRTLSDLRESLRQHGSDLLVLSGEPLAVWKKLLTGEHKISTVYVNDDDEPSARARDVAVEKLLAKEGIPLNRFKDQVVFENDEVTKDDGKPYTVFTPYSKKWRAVLVKLQGEGRDPLKAEKCAPYFDHLLKFEGSLPTLKEIGFTENVKLDFPSMKVATETLTKYGSLRDLPAIKGTSHLGLHLRFGTVSIRRLVAKALELSAEVWLSELIWREFFMQILRHFPHVVENAFRPEYDRIAWRTDEKQFEAWSEGKTGYPLVDAGMRELNATGFMHNRVRMVTASFLVKHLLIDWRWGEAYFARKLLDFDLSANNGNWQWVAGSGCDAAPYFRVFNPELQAKRFDPKNEYIKKWVPEFGTPKQLAPIVDHQEARARVLRAYAVVKEKI